ncbi:MAG: M12 family metallo-peptidase [Myxococcales bacterium]
MPLFRLLPRWLATALLIGLGSQLAACFYDHRITQAIVERRKRAREAEGAKLRKAPGVALPSSALKHGRIRFYVSKEYRQQHTDFQTPLRSLVDQANDIVGSNFGVRFEVALITEWSPACNPERLQDCVNELVKTDPGEDGDWVVGMMGALPSFTSSFDLLGMARVMSHHFVLRDVSDLAERAAIDRAFASFTSARRDEIYQHRKTHKRLCVFLHEWGHTLGAMHVDSKESLLNPAYDEHMQSFDEANHGLVAASLRDRFQYAGKHEELLAYLEGSASAGFAPAARDELLAMIKPAPPEAVPASALASSGSSAPALTTPAPEAPPQHAFLVQGDEAEVLRDVEPADRDVYKEAAKLTAAGDSFGALKLMEPLCARYPKNYAVQYLGCGLAMQLGYRPVAHKACPAVQQLASGK